MLPMYKKNNRLVLYMVGNIYRYTYWHIRVYLQIHGKSTLLLKTFIYRYTWEIALGRHICLKHILFSKCLPKARDGHPVSVPALVTGLCP